MAFFKWDESISVGIPIIDAEHRSLIDYVNQLYKAGEGENTYQSVGTILNSIVDLLIYHFRREERAMQAAGYPGLDAHRAAHREFEDYLLTHREIFHAYRGSAVDQEVLDHIKQWLIDHIEEVDMKMAPYTRGNPDAIAAADEVEFDRHGD